MTEVLMKRLPEGGVMFSIPGEPVAKGRPRVTARGTFTPKATREYEARVAGIARVVRTLRYVTTQLDADAWQVTIHLYRYKRTKADADNMVKAIIDGMNGVLYADDSQVEAGGWSTEWVSTAQEARAEVFATPLPHPPRPPR